MQDEYTSSSSTETESVAADLTSDEQAEAQRPITSVLRAALPRLREIALHVALTGPVVLSPLLPDSHGHGGGWSG